MLSVINTIVCIITCFTSLASLIAVNVNLVIGYSKKNILVVDNLANFKSVQFFTVSIEILATADAANEKLQPNPS